MSASIDGVFPYPVAWTSRYTSLTVSRHGVPLLRALQAESFLARLQGLHALPPLGPSHALLIRPCSAVQTWRMGYPIDVVFLDAHGRVLRLCRAQRGTVRLCRAACMVMEVACGTADRLGLGVGQTLVLTEHGDVS